MDPQPDTAAELDGQAGFVEMAPEPALATGFTIEAWIKPGGNPATPGWRPAQVIFSALDVVAGDRLHGFVLVLHREGGTTVPPVAPGVRVVVGTGNPEGGNKEAFVALPPGGPGDAWRHVVATYDPGAGPGAETLRLSVSSPDAPLDVTTQGGSYRRNDNQRMRIGAGRRTVDPTAANFFAGRIDEVALYDVALDANRIQAHFLAAQPG